MCDHRPGSTGVRLPATRRERWVISGVDLVRGLLWVLLPVSILSSLVLVWQGVPMNFSPYTHALGLDGGGQVIAQGPVAALESANSVFYNVTTGLAMMLGRFGLAIPALALAGSFGRQNRRPVTMGTFPAYTPTFGLLLVSTALVVGGLNYFPALALGPILEHLKLAG